MTKNPSISVIIPYDKDRGYLDMAVESVKRQTFKDYELIISHSEKSAGYNMNKGIERATGKYLVYLCEDDLLTKESLQDRFNFMEANDFDFIHSRAMRLYENGYMKQYGLTNPYAQFNCVLQDNGICGGSTMYKTEILKSNLFNEELTTAEEWELHLRLLNNNYKLGFLDKVTYILRQHPEQKSIGNLDIEYQKRRQAIKDKIKSWYTTQQ